MFAFQRHKLAGKPTQGGALYVQFDAFTHHVDILFLQARKCAVFASRSALITGFCASLVFCMHDLSPQYLCVMR